MNKFFRIAFGLSGDRASVPDAADPSGNVSYTQGYGFDYQRQKTDPAAKDIERDKMNQLWFEVTAALAELQSQGIPDFITSVLNGGSAYSYAQNAVVRYSGDMYVSLVAANTALPTDATKWALLPIPSRLQSALNTRATAGGTADALTGAFTPAIAALPAAPDTLYVMVRAASANATATPTFKADGTTAKTIVKGSNQALVAGDIAGAGHWLHLNYDATLDKWILLNPATGVVNHGAQTFTAGTSNFTVPAGVSTVHITAAAGGGGGGGGGTGQPAGGGGGGQSIVKQAVAVTPGAVISVTIGTGGNGGAVGGNGGAGNNTTFGGLLTLTGGGAGLNNGGAGASGGGMSQTGQQASTTITGLGGKGGGTAFGDGGHGGIGGNTGAPAGTNTGGGGGGGSGTGAGTLGAAGATGILIVEW